MSSVGSLGLLPGVLLVGLLLVGATAGTGLLSTEPTSEADLSTLVDDVVTDMTSYLKVQQILGKFEAAKGGGMVLTRIAILVRPLVNTRIDLSTMLVQVITGERALALPLQAAAPITTEGLFQHPLWEDLSPSSFGVLAVVDSDSSLSSYRTLSGNCDTAFIIIRLPAYLGITKGQTIELTLLPNPGMERHFTVEVPLPSTSVVSLYG